MKRTAAILLSLMFVWLQTMAAAPLSFASVAPPRSCCSCDKTCCVSPITPDSQSLPLAPAPASGSQDFSALAPMRVTWSLPASDSSGSFAYAPTSFPAPAVPLFTRHCARLI